MRSTSHGEHLTQITRFGAVNAFFVREPDGLTLVDTSVPRSAAQIVAAADAIGAPIVRIVLTHAHPDHAGSVDALVATLPAVELLVGAREARLLAGDRTPDQGEPPPRGRYQRTRTRPTRTLVAGDRVGSLSVHGAPGHTPGQIALLDERDRTLLAGDAYTTLFGVGTAAKPTWRLPFVALASWHRPTALVSARSLRALDPARLAVGHGPVIEAPGPQMERALKSAGA
ncbi:MAG: beta-lactamase domain protein [Conexibacter sp.]|nr:beta-lactamase domain protein [Conexibacter sp.]